MDPTLQPRPDNFAGTGVSVLRVGDRTRPVRRRALLEHRPGVRRYGFVVERSGVLVGPGPPRYVLRLGILGQGSGLLDQRLTLLLRQLSLGLVDVRLSFLDLRLNILNQRRSILGSRLNLVDLLFVVRLGSGPAWDDLVGYDFGLVPRLLVTQRAPRVIGDERAGVRGRYLLRHQRVDASDLFADENGFLGACLGVGRDEGIDPAGPGIGVDDERLDEQRRGQGEQGAQRPEDDRPHEQRQERDRTRDAHGLAGHLWLDDSLDDEVQHRVQHDDEQRTPWPLGEQAHHRRRDEADDEADVRDVVRHERQYGPHDGQRDPVRRKAHPRQRRDDEAEHGRGDPVLADTLRERLQREDEYGVVALHEPLQARLEVDRVHHHEQQHRDDDHEQRHRTAHVQQQRPDDAHHAARVDRLELVDDLGARHAELGGQVQRLVVHGLELPLVLGDLLHEQRRRPADGPEQQADDDDRQQPGHDRGEHLRHASREESLHWPDDDHEVQRQEERADDTRQLRETQQEHDDRSSTHGES